MALLLYSAVCGALWICKPAAVFDDDQAPRPYGSQPGHTRLPLSALCLVVAVAAYAYARSLGVRPA